MIQRGKVLEHLFDKPLKMQENRVSYLIPGGTMLDAFYGHKSEDNTQPSQAWLASVVESAVGKNGTGLSRLTADDGACLFRDLLNSHGDDFLGPQNVERYGNTPGFLLKLLNSSHRLLVQTHPDKTRALKYFGKPFGKTEVWYVAATEEGATAYAWMGFKPHVSPEQFQKLIEKQDTSSILDCLCRFEIKKGDILIIRPGTPHTLGAHSLVVELQEPIDITLRAERILFNGTELPEESLHSGIGMEALLDSFLFAPKDMQEVKDKFFICPEINYPAPGCSEKKLITNRTTSCFSMSEFSINGGQNFNKTKKAIKMG